MWLIIFMIVLIAICLFAYDLKLEAEYEKLIKEEKDYDKKIEEIIKELKCR